VLQTPPQVSAVHSDGERAYLRARRGETMALAPRPVTIQRLELLAWDQEGARLSLAVRCSAGTYIRSLARDLGDALGCGGCLADLRRTEALGFGLEQAVGLERLGEAPPPALIDPLLALPHLRRQQLSPTELESWRCGRAIPAENDAAQAGAADAVAVVAPDGNLAGIARADGTGLLRPKLVFDAAG
jgi:tRNA pseudouridine55 synthase